MRAHVLENKLNLRAKRKKRIRAKISGCEETPRVSVFRSNRHFYAQAVNDVTGTTLAYIDGKKLGLSSNKESATKLGADFAEVLKSKGITKVAFDRNGYLYHGVVAAFAAALREAGITL
jgi:large subunit ribosomal protein L18